MKSTDRSNFSFSIARPSCPVAVHPPVRLLRALCVLSYGTSAIATLYQRTRCSRRRGGVKESELAKNKHYSAHTYTFRGRVVYGEVSTVSNSVLWRTMNAMLCFCWKFHFTLQVNLFISASGWCVWWNISFTSCQGLDSRNSCEFYSAWEGQALNLPALRATHIMAVLILCLTITPDVTNGLNNSPFYVDGNYLQSFYVFYCLIHMTVPYNNYFANCVQTIMHLKTILFLIFLIWIR